MPAVGIGELLARNRLPTAGGIWGAAAGTYATGKRAGAVFKEREIYRARVAVGGQMGQPLGREAAREAIKRFGRRDGGDGFG